MIIKGVHIKNFRCIKDETLTCDPLTVLVGANGAGKSSFLRGLDLFYNPSPRLDVQDFYAGDTTGELVVSVTFKELTEEARRLFSNYLQEGELTVERVFTCKDQRMVAKYHGATLQNTDFQAIRDSLEIKDRGKTAKQAYEVIRAKADYHLLPDWSALGAVAGTLKEWEGAHPGRCSRQRDDGQFFGFTEVAQGYLGRFTRMLFIPAVREASEDATEGRNSALTGLMDLVVRSVLANKDALKKLKDETQRQYLEIMDPSQLTELSDLGGNLTGTLRTFVPDASLDLRWLPLQELDFPLPKADVKLIEDGYPSAVGRTGHGLQRAFILTMLQHLALAQTPRQATPSEAATVTAPPAERKLPDLVLVIEEPELYQHPNRQRHFAKILLQLSSGKTPGVAERTQVIYSTHAPLFVGIDRIEQVRVLRKAEDSPDKPKITRVVHTTGDEIAEMLWKADGAQGQKYTGETLLPRLQALMTPWMSEGFFAQAAVLVEGEDDRAAVLGMAEVMGHDLESSGFSVIPCGGKTSMDRPIAIFQRLGIPVYSVWDGDEGEDGARPEDNHRLLRLMGQEIQDWPSAITGRFACFKRNLETTLREELGPDNFERWVADCQQRFCIRKRGHALKNPHVIASMIRNAEAEGRTSESLRAICEKILALS